MILGLETSTATGGAALLAADRLLGSVTFTSPALHAQRLMPSVEWLLQRTGRSLADLQGIAVAIGPGSFTGLRIGLSAAKALAYATRTPLFGISTLEGLALRAAVASAAAAPGLPICALLDARQGEVYAGLFQLEPPPAPSRGTPLPLPSLHRLRDDYAGPLAAYLPQAISGPTIFAGDGTWKYADLLRQQLGENFLLTPALANLPCADEIAWLGAQRLAANTPDDPFLLTPDYLRRSYTQRR